MKNSIICVRAGATAPVHPVAEPVWQADCERCGKELFDTTERQFWALCQSCADEEHANSPQAVAEREAQFQSDLADYRAWRAS